MADRTRVRNVSGADSRVVFARVVFARVVFGMAVAVTVSSYAVLLGKPAFVDFWAGREMAFETLGALAFLAAAFFFARSACCPACWPAPRGRRFTLALLALFFFVAAGEELSWGQHFFGFETPEGLKHANVQEELNLHNLAIFDSYDARTGEKKAGLAAWLNSNRLFDYFMVGFFWLAPALAPLLRARSEWLRRLDPPVPRPRLGLLLLLSFGLTLLVELTLVDGMLRHLAVSEIREFNYAWLCALAAWQFLASRE
jgi:hypothetical protein